MARCEDFPCCGHTSGDPCPDRDRAGRIVARCVECSVTLRRGARSSICLPCQRRLARRAEYGDDYMDYPSDY